MKPLIIKILNLEPTENSDTELKFEQVTICLYFWGHLHFCGLSLFEWCTSFFGMSYF